MMTKDYAVSFWTGLIRSLHADPEKRIMTNPAVEFTEKAKSGCYNRLSDEEYNIMLENIEQENALFQRKPCATSYTILLRALQKIHLTDTELHTVLRILTAAALRTDFRKESDRK